MLRTGLYLLSGATLGIIYRSGNFPFSAHSYLKWFCLSGLCVSLACFLSTYLLDRSPAVE